ncbi:MAG: acetyl-CoA carboxylase biotin carboxyl carrier protein [Bacteroidia bacterium]|jgi:acetyl-CoA carboxylase biotin carboxyl carrier protein
MDLKEIQTLVKLVSSSKVDHLEIDKKDFSIKIKKNATKTEVVSVASGSAMAGPIAAYQVDSAPAAPSSTPAENAPADSLSGEEIKSPMIGTFYRSPSPDKPNFVEVGDEIREGQTICIVEAMKLFNEIESEVSGRIVKVLVDDASPVEYDQPLFIVEPI